MIKTALLCFMTVMTVLNSAAAPKGSSSTFMAPDFAFPGDVSAEAAKVYDQSMRDGDAMRALMAAMELNVASRLISRSDSVVPTLERYQRIARKFEAPYSSLAELLEATVLAGVYNSNRYVYNQRTLPADSADAEPTLWSGDQFRARVGALLREVLNDKSRLDATPIGDISLILTGGAAASAEGMTAYDFAVYKVLDLAAALGLQSSDPQSLPFKVVAAESAESTKAVEAEVDKADNAEKSYRFDSLKLIDSLIAADERGSAADPDRAGALCYARLQRLGYVENQADRKEYVKSLLSLYPSGNALRPRVLLSLYNNACLDDAEAYALLSVAAEEYPHSVETPCLKSICNQIVLPSLSFNTKSQWLSNDVAKIYCNYSNVERINVLLVPVSANFAESNNPKIRNISPAGKILNLSSYESVRKAPYSGKDTVSVDVSRLGLKPAIMP